VLAWAPACWSWICCATEAAHLQSTCSSDSAASPQAAAAWLPGGLVSSPSGAPLPAAWRAGPLCDEPLWGVLFEFEARLHLTPGEAGGQLRLDLQEDVYGPFSGQVGAVWTDWPVPW
jgi:hypothetical protein